MFAKAENFFNVDCTFFGKLSLQDIPVFFLAMNANVWFEISRLKMNEATQKVISDGNQDDVCEIHIFYIRSEFKQISRQVHQERLPRDEGIALNPSQLRSAILTHHSTRIF